MHNPILSTCIPCYKRIQYVRNTLRSIYKENSDVPLSDYEVVISDNDSDHEVKQLLSEFRYDNLFYYATDCEGFTNSYHVLTYGRGSLLKLHNSQVLFRKGTLRFLIEEAKYSLHNKPLIFYTNGFLYKNKSESFNSFDSFFKGLNYWPSWSNGFSIWKEDFEKIGEVSLDLLFPHTSLFITQHNKQSYVINDNYLFETQRVKGRSGHNKFEAFTIHFPALIDVCYKKGWITKRTKIDIFNDMLKVFLPILLFNKYIARVERFDITGYRTNIKKYFPRHAFAVSILFITLFPIRLIMRRVNLLIAENQPIITLRGEVIQNDVIILFKNAELLEERRAA